MMWSNSCQNQLFTYNIVDIIIIIVDVNCCSVIQRYHLIMQWNQLKLVVVIVR